MLDEIYQPDNLIRFAAVAEDKYYILFSQPAQVAVDRFGWMQKMAGRAGGGQCRADFSANDTGLADTADYAEPEQL